MAHLGMICRHNQAPITFPLDTKFPKRPHRPDAINPAHARSIHAYTRKMRSIRGVFKHINDKMREAFWTVEFAPLNEYWANVHYLVTANKGEFHQPLMDVFVIGFGTGRAIRYMVYRRMSGREMGLKTNHSSGVKRVYKHRTRYPVKRLGPLGMREWPTVDPEWMTDTVKSFLGTPFPALEQTHLKVMADALQDAGCDSPILEWLRHPEPEIAWWGHDALKYGYIRQQEQARVTCVEVAKLFDPLEPR